MVEAFTTQRGTEEVPLTSEILARIEADRTLPDETRTTAVALVNSLRREKELQEAAWTFAVLPNQPQEKYQRALRYANDACAVDDGLSAAWGTRGLAHYRLNQFAEALADLQRCQELAAAEKLSPSAEDLTVFSMVQHQLAQPEEAQSTLQQARLAFNRSLSSWPRLLAEAETLLKVPNAEANPALWIGRRFMPRLGAYLQSERNTARSPDLPYLISKVEGDRLWVGTEHWIGRSQVVALEEARLHYAHASGARTPGISIYNYRGIVSRELGELDQAIEDYSAAIQMEPSSAFVWNNRGRVWLEKKDFEKALTDFDESLKLEPSNAQYLLYRGEAQYKQGEFDDALKTVDEALLLEPDNDWAYLLRANVWSAKGDGTQMLRDFDELIRRDPARTSTLNARAWLLATSPNADHRNGKQAVDDATEACKLTSWNEFNSLDTLAAAYAESSEFEQAVKWQEKALVLAPLARRADFESRLQLYRDRKPFHEMPITKPVTNAPAPSTD